MSISFSELQLSPNLLRAINDLAFEKPTPIQEKAIPVALAGQDVIGIAQTGTGKTAAFVLPMLHKLKYAQGNEPRALILAPSKELAMQIDKEVTNFSKYTDIRHTVIYGGVGATNQLKLIEQGLDLIVATPGRFWDLYKRGGVPTRKLKLVVLDEADKLMDMGFMPQLRQLQEVMPQKRQNLLFSATFSPKVEELSAEFLEFPTKIEIAPQSTAVETVSQYFYKVPNLKTKINLLEHLLQDEEKFKRVLVFINTKKTAVSISKYLSRKLEEEALVIHSNKSQNSRIHAINQFSEGKIRVLVSTDVSARGIDIQDVSHVINFEVPSVYQEYVHRIGRTGRAEKEGNAITFANEFEMIHLRRIKKMSQSEMVEIDFPLTVSLEETPKEERLAVARKIDYLKQKEDPNYKGAFHAKKEEKKKNNTKDSLHQYKKNKAKGKIKKRK